MKGLGGPSPQLQGTRKGLPVPQTGFPYYGRHPPSLPWNFAPEENGCDFVTVVTVRNGEARDFRTYGTSGHMGLGVEVNICDLGTFATSFFDG